MEEKIFLILEVDFENNYQRPFLSTSDTEEEVKEVSLFSNGEGGLKH